MKDSIMKKSGKNIMRVEHNARCMTWKNTAKRCKK